MLRSMLLISTVGLLSRDYDLAHLSGALKKSHKGLFLDLLKETALSINEYKIGILVLLGINCILWSYDNLFILGLHKRKPTNPEQQ